MDEDHREYTTEHFTPEEDYTVFKTSQWMNVSTFCYTIYSFFNEVALESKGVDHVTSLTLGL